MLCTNCVANKTERGLHTGEGHLNQDTRGAQPSRCHLWKEVSTDHNLKAKHLEATVEAVKFNDNIRKIIY
jgi:hypothetical protein